MRDGVSEDRLTRRVVSADVLPVSDDEDRLFLNRIDRILAWFTPM
jgi:hypothetical protein